MTSCITAQDSFEASTGGPPSPDRQAFGSFAPPAYGYGPAAAEGSPLGYAGTTAGGAPVTTDAAVPRYRPSLQARTMAPSVLFFLALHRIKSSSPSSFSSVYM